MQWAGKAMDVLTRASNNNIVFNTFLVGVFAALCVRSANQQNEIQALEAEKNSLTKANKASQKSMWDWKQQLFAEATVDGSPVPLSRIKAIYGEAFTGPEGVAVAPASESTKPPATKFVV